MYLLNDVGVRSGCERAQCEDKLVSCQFGTHRLVAQTDC